MNAAILDEDGTVMQYVGDAVMAVFGAPFPQDDHAERRRRGRRRRCTSARPRVERRVGGARASTPFGLGIGLSTGEVAAALLGSDERLEYTVVGDTVNLSQRLQDLARPAGTTVLSERDRRRRSSAAARRAAEPHRRRSWSRGGTTPGRIGRSDDRARSRSRR